MMLSTLSHSTPPVYAPPAAAAHQPAMLPILPARPPASSSSSSSSSSTSSSSQRPKLSVNTSQPRTFGKGASLRLDTLSAVSPTRINTFSNAYPALDRPSTTTTTTTTPSSASTLSSALTSTSSDSAPLSLALPYKQPHNIASILVNSPARHLIPRKMAASRPMFTPTKRVSFRTPLQENITNVKYTLAHSDLDSTLTSEQPRPSKHAPSAAHHSLHPPSPAGKAASFSSVDSSPCPKGPRIGEKRDSSSSEDDSDPAPETPVAGRRKRTRDWRWTLDPLPGPGTSNSSTASQSITHNEAS